MFICIIIYYKNKYHLSTYNHSKGIISTNTCTIRIYVHITFSTSVLFNKHNYCYMRVVVTSDTSAVPCARRVVVYHAKLHCSYLSKCLLLQSSNLFTYDIHVVC